MIRVLQFKQTENAYVCVENGNSIFEISKIDLQFNVKNFYYAFYGTEQENEEINLINRPLENWDEVITKVGEFDHAVESFLKNCECEYSPSERKYYIVSNNKLMATMLGSDKNKKYIFDSMICCDVDITSVSQIEIILKTSKAKKSDLDDFI